MSTMAAALENLMEENAREFRLDPTVPDRVWCHPLDEEETRIRLPSLLVKAKPLAPRGKVLLLSHKGLVGALDLRTGDTYLFGSPQPPPSALGPEG